MFPSAYTTFRWSPVKILAVAIFGIFIIQAIEQVWLNSSFLSTWGSLSVDALKEGQVWRLISYAFLHGGFWHMLANVLGLIFIGLALEEELGDRAMMLILGLFALAGGLAFTAVHIMSGGALMGASAATIGLLTLYCLSYPDRPITLLLFFVLPVTVLPRYILYFTLAINLFGFVFAEVAPGASGNVGYSAHLGGMLAAWAISRWCLKNTFPFGSSTFKAPSKVEAPGWVKKHILFKGQEAPKNYSVNLSSRAALQKEVDRILDKINTKGFGALTKDEKATLDKAKDILGK